METNIDLHDNDGRMEFEELDFATGGARVVTACQCDNRWEAWIATYFSVCPGTTTSWGS
jgi:hypothetical protein